MRSLIRAGIAVVVLSLSLAAPVAAEPFEDGTAAYTRGGAQYGLGVIYQNGQGGPQDYVAAVSWYRKAADQGHVYAQSNLGVMYGTGRGVRRDLVSAHLWLNLAAAGGIKDAAHNRDLLAARMTRAQIAEAKSRAAAWRPSKRTDVPVAPT